MSRVMETFSTISDWPEHTPDQAISKLVAMGWEVIEQKDDCTMLTHELIPGASRVVLHT